MSALLASGDAESDGGAPHGSLDGSSRLSLVGGGNGAVGVGHGGVGRCGDVGTGEVEAPDDVLMRDGQGGVEHGKEHDSDSEEAGHFVWRG